jgi:excisionase family DNA binding protein
VTYLTVRQAAEQVGVSRQTMFRHVKDGRVSATVDRDGQKQIDVAELLRVFGAIQSPVATAKTVNDRSRLTQKNETAPGLAYQIELEKLRAQLELKAAELALAKERISELKSREHQVVEEKNRLLTLIEQQSRLLAAPIPKAAPRKKAVLSVAQVVPKIAASKPKAMPKKVPPSAVKAVR